MAVKSKRPYQIAYQAGTEARIAVRGEPTTLANLITFPGAHIHGKSLAAPDSYVTLPATRLAVLIAEALATPASISPNYKAARPGLVAYDRRPIQDFLAQFPFSLNRQLMAHQEEFCSFAMPSRGSLNASERGTGKTTMGLYMALTWNCPKTLIVTGKSIISEWEDEHRLIFGDSSSFPIYGLVDGTIKDRSKKIRYLANVDEHCFVGINYEVLKELEPAIMDWAPNLVIYDESHRLKSRGAKVTKAATRIADLCDRVLLMTGTPIGNDIGDLYSQVRIIFPHLEHLGYKSWMSRFARFVSRDYGMGPVLKPIGIQDPAGLMQILEPFWYRAPRSVCADLPPPKRRKVKIEMPEDMKILYKAVEEHGEAALGNRLSLNDERVVLLRLQQISGGWRPEWLEPEDQEDLDAGGRWRLIPLEFNPKMSWLRQWATDHLLDQPDARAIVWVRFNHELLAIASALREILGHDMVATAYGPTKDSEIREMKAAFNARDPERDQVIVAQIKKIKEGQNLQAGDYQIFYSNSWSHIEREQCEGRSDRMGRTEAVEIIDLIMRNTVDVTIIEALERKEDLDARVCHETAGSIS